MGPVDQDGDSQSDRECDRDAAGRGDAALHPFRQAQPRRVLIGNPRQRQNAAVEREQEQGAESPWALAGCSSDGLKSGEAAARV
jgi:hypothetical protein